ncbi:WecB/TagA/CpsF family glycosyltransferase [Williamsia serinedens]|uniref:N-acetylglucosaminyldiphosphoundecaprenol N-acetyl-beta-D-mannosaminyltransferase n=1 Tax=Williamsia serinedens TaxID=391736 RepID=A0ABT1H5R3_9NOCA|nr:N-acetylglucosaminyldiphosphoundecaprenol N-acetyl-beta-D-mannosaminyltransferase [Williamsia serinedens]
MNTIRYQEKSAAREKTALDGWISFPMPRVYLPLLGISVSAVGTEDVVEAISKNTGQRLLICSHNMHSLYLRQSVPGFSRIENFASLILADGFPVWLAARLRLCGPAGDSPASQIGGLRRRIERIGSTDWLLADGFRQQSLRIAVVGARSASNALAVKALERACPSSCVRGWNGFEDLASLRATNYDALQGFRPDIVLFGLGMPTQESLVVNDYEKLPKCTIALVGGAIDQISGAQTLCPRWLARLGVEWLWRLADDPRRLSRRYLLEPLLLAVLFVSGKYSRSGTL